MNNEPLAGKRAKLGLKRLFGGNVGVAVNFSLDCGLVFNRSHCVEGLFDGVELESVFDDSFCLSVNDFVDDLCVCLSGYGECVEGSGELLLVFDCVTFGHFVDIQICCGKFTC